MIFLRKNIRKEVSEAKVNKKELKIKRKKDKEEIINILRQECNAPYSILGFLTLERLRIDLIIKNMEKE